MIVRTFWDANISQKVTTPRCERPKLMSKNYHNGNPLSHDGSQHHILYINATLVPLPAAFVLWDVVIHDEIVDHDLLCDSQPIYIGWMSKLAYEAVNNSDCWACHEQSRSHVELCPWKSCRCWIVLALRIFTKRIGGDPPPPVNANQSAACQTHIIMSMLCIFRWLLLLYHGMECVIVSFVIISSCDPVFTDGLPLCAYLYKCHNTSGSLIDAFPHFQYLKLHQSECSCAC